MDNNDIEKMWEDADFKPEEKNLISKAFKQRIVKDNKFIAYCKICNKEINLSCAYTGDYPLCYIHRDPNDRPLINKSNKSKSNKGKK